MSRATGVRSAPVEDERLADLPMTPVRCLRCHATVRVRKASMEQTSVQWDSESARACLERPTLTPGVLLGAGFAGCAALGESIARAAASGEIPLAGDAAAVGGGSAPNGRRGAAGPAAEERAVAQ